MEIASKMWWLGDTQLAMRTDGFEMIGVACPRKLDGAHLTTMLAKSASQSKMVTIGTIQVQGRTIVTTDMRGGPWGAHQVVDNQFDVVCADPADTTGLVFIVKMGDSFWRLVVEVHPGTTGVKVTTKLKSSEVAMLNRKLVWKLD